MKSKTISIGFMIFIYAPSLLFSQTIEERMQDFFDNDDFTIIQFDEMGLYWGFLYIDDEHKFFNKMLVLSAITGGLNEVFRLENEVITDYWSNKPQKAPMRRDSEFYGYQVVIKDDLSFKLSVYTNGGKHFIRDARVYFWKSEKNQFEPLY